jgi:SAM-dependent methyltransferase
MMADISNLKSVIRKCPVCLKGKGIILHTQEFVLPENYPLPNAYDIVECQSCGFVYADTTASQADYNLFYANLSKYEDKSVATGGGDNLYDAHRLEQTASDIRKVLPDKNASVLDIGCGNGGLLLALKHSGYNNVTGLDPSRKCVATVRGQGINALAGDIFSADFDAQFDCIILSHVLEHIYDLRGAVRRLTSWLRVDGISYVEVPDASRYSDYYVVPYYYFDIEHINHFDEHSMNNLILSSDHFIPVVSSAKEITVSNGNIYPVFFAIYRKKDDRTADIVPSFIVGESVKRYLKMSDAHGRWPELNELSEDQKEVIVWGAGSFTQRLLNNTALSRCNIVAFVDNDSKKQGLTINNVKIHSPSILRIHKGPIIVCSAFHSDEILHEIEEMGIINPVIVIR